LGTSGRRFESCHSDILSLLYNVAGFFIIFYLIVHVYEERVLVLKYTILIGILVFSCSPTIIDSPQADQNSSTSYNEIPISSSSEHSNISSSSGDLVLSSSQAISIWDEPVLSLIDKEDITPDSTLEKLWSQEISNLQVLVRAKVTKILSDDTVGSQHQRFIVQLQSGQTLLIAHNIDLAPRVANLQENKLIYIYGEYEWNEQGGVIHWTHKDPKDDSNSHVNGWILFEGEKVE
jgi:hypothetical protein